MKLRYYIGIIFVITSFHVMYLMADGLIDDKKKAKYGVILGNKVEKNGEPSKRLKKRLDCGAQLYLEGNVKKLIVSGALGKEGYNEAVVMSEYLIREKNISKKDIILDEKGYTTYDTVLNVLFILKENNLDTIIVVSQYFHITRAKLTFRKLGVKHIFSASPLYFEMRDFYSIPREIIALYYYWIFKT